MPAIVMGPALVLLNLAIAFVLTTGEVNTASNKQLPLPNDVYWSSDVEKKMQRLFSEEEGERFRRKATTLRVVSLQMGCGRMKNRLAVLEDGTKVCCRYRDNKNELRGDLYSYHFNDLLRMWNASPTTIVKVDFSSSQWTNVANTAIEAGWEDGSPVVMVLYIDGLEKVYMPNLLKPEDTVLDLESMNNISASDQMVLMQWTDMIVFDFIIGHTDRLFSNLLNLQWNPHMMEKCIQNLERSQSGNLLLIDNESGFWIGYVSANKKPSNYQLQVFFLQRICLFRRSTIEAIEWLHSSGQGDIILEEHIHSTDNRSYSSVRKLNSAERKEFLSRLGVVLERIQDCSAMNMSTNAM